MLPVSQWIFCAQILELWLRGLSFMIMYLMYGTFLYHVLLWRTVMPWTLAVMVLTLNGAGTILNYFKSVERYDIIILINEIYFSKIYTTIKCITKISITKIYKINFYITMYIIFAKSYIFKFLVGKAHVERYHIKTFITEIYFSKICSATKYIAKISITKIYTINFYITMFIIFAKFCNLNFFIDKAHIIKICINMNCLSQNAFYVLGVYLTDVCSITLSILKIYFWDVNLIKTSVIQSLLYNLIKISVIQFYPLKNNLSKNFLSKIYLSETYNYLSIVNLLKNLCAKIQKISYIKSSTSYPTVFLFISQILEIKLLKINVFIFYVPRLNLYFFKFSFQENFLKHYTLLQKLLSSNNLIFYHGS